MAQLAKNPPAMRETWVPSLGWADPLEKGKATHSSSLAWRVPWTVQSLGRKQSGTTERLSLALSLFKLLGFLVVQGFPCGSAGKEYACNMGDLGPTTALGRSPSEGNGYLLEYSGHD